MANMHSMPKLANLPPKRGTKMRSRSATPRMCGVVVMLSVILTLAVPSILALPALAQSPGPGHHYTAVGPGHRTLAYAGVAVQALGMDGCDSRKIDARDDIIYYVNHSEPVWLEISPQSCSTIGTYESEINGMLNYIAANTPSVDEGEYFDGVMLDEETGFGFSVSQLVTLNTYVQQRVIPTSGNTWWSLEGFSSNGSNANGCEWSYAQYENIITNGFQAQQIEHLCNIRLANDEPTYPTLVTWNSNYDPGDTQAHASNPVDAPAYHDAGLSYLWSNEFLPT